MGIKALAESTERLAEGFRRVNAEIRAGVTELERSSIVPPGSGSPTGGGFNSGSFGPQALTELGRIRRELTSLKDEVGLSGPRQGAVARRSK